MIKSPVIVSPPIFPLSISTISNAVYHEIEGLEDFVSGEILDVLEELFEH